MATTYKTIISNAIKGYNDIQDKLHNIGSSYTLASGAVQSIPASVVSGSKTPLSINNILAADAFQSATISAEKVGNITPPSVTITKVSGTAKISSTQTSYTITIGKSVTDGSGSIRGKATKSGYIKSGSTSSSVSLGNIEPLVSGDGTVYIQAGAYSASGEVKGKPSAVASLAGTGTTLSGISKTKPISGTDGTNYWTFSPKITGSDGLVTAKASIATEGYIKDTAGKASNVPVSVTRTTEASYYINKLTSVTLTASGTGVVTVGSASDGYYPVSATVSITGTVGASGYAVKDQSFSASGSKAVGKIAGGAYSASATNAASGFTASSSSTSWYVESTPKATISTAGYIAAGNKNGTVVKTYIPGAVIKNGFTTNSGMVTANTANYVTVYNSTDKCVDIKFNS